MNESQSFRSGGSQIIPRPASRRPGGPAPWKHGGVDLSLVAIRDRLDGRDARATSAPRPDERMSAVLGLLAHGPHGAEILLTRRSATLTNHRGEISFPGGRADEGESIVEAALRETHEEVGIPSHQVIVHTELSPMSTFVSRSYIVPVIGSLSHKPELKPNPEEVDRAFWVPLAELTRPDTFTWEWWAFDHEGLREEREMYFFYLDDETIWGATARMLHELLCLVHGESK